jgi:hypothetical protein
VKQTNVHFKYTKQDDDSIVSESGCNYESLQDFIHTDIFGFCGCGMSEDVDSLIYNILTILNIQNSLTFKEYKARLEMYLPTDALQYFMFYWLDFKGFTKHGGSVPGWLSDKGHELLNLLDLVYEKENSK